MRICAWCCLWNDNVASMFKFHRFRLSVGFIVLVPLFDFERSSFVPGEIITGDQDTPFLHGPKLSEVTQEENYRDPTEILRTAAKCAQLFVHGV